MEIAILGLIGTIIGALIGAFVAWRLAKGQRVLIEKQIEKQEQQNLESTQNLQRQLDYQKEQLRFASEGRVDRALDLFQRFRYDHMRNARTIAWRAREKWYTDSSYRDKLTNHMYRNIDYEQLNEEEQSEFTAIYDMVEFYSMLAVHQGNDEEIKAFGFYYSWWRGFLFEIQKAHESEYEKLGLSDEEKAQFPPVPWIKNIEKLEERLKLPAYSKELHPMDRKYLPPVKNKLLQQGQLPANSTEQFNGREGETATLLKTSPVKP